MVIFFTFTYPFPDFFLSSFSHSSSSTKNNLINNPLFYECLCPWNCIQYFIRLTRSIIPASLGYPPLQLLESSQNQAWVLLLGIIQLLITTSLPVVINIFKHVLILINLTIRLVFCKDTLDDKTLSDLVGLYIELAESSE